jgi:hypothetical protein
MVATMVLMLVVVRLVGIVNSAVPGVALGPQPDWDPDIVAALDDDFNMDDPSNMLDDDFVMKANASGGEEEEDDDEDVSPHREDTMTRYFRSVTIVYILKHAY